MVKTNSRKFKATALILTLAVLSNVFVVETALADNEAVAQTMSAGQVLSVTAPTANSSTTSLTGAATVSTSAQVATGTITGIVVNDGRGNVPGWTVSSTSTNLGLQGAGVLATARMVTATGDLPITVANNVGITGIYDGLNANSHWSGIGIVPAGEFKIVAHAVDGVTNLPTSVDITKADGTTVGNPVTVVNQQVTFNGLTVAFTANLGEKWAAGDDLRFIADAFPYTSMTVTPASLGSTGNYNTNSITLGSASVYTDSAPTSQDGAPVDVTSATRAANELVAAQHAGQGVFQFNMGLSQKIHAYPIAGSYKSTITLSII